MTKKLCKNIIAFVLVLIMLLSTACTNSQQYVADDTFEPMQTDHVQNGQNVTAPVSGGMVSFAVGKYGSLNPLTTDNEDIRQYMSLVYSNLVSLDYSGYPQAELAANWSCDETSTKWTFMLREGIRWHDENEFKAEDVVATLNYIKTNGGSYLKNVANIKNISATDGKTVVIECKSADGMFPCKMSIPIVRESALKNGTVHTLPVGTGVYKYDISASTKTKLCLEKSDANADTKLCENISMPYIDRVEINVYENETKKYSSDSDLKILYDEALKAEYLTANTKQLAFSGDMYVYLLPKVSGNSVMANADMRNAISCFIDRENMIKAASGGNGTAVTLPAHKGTFCWQGDGAQNVANVQKGAELLEKLGYKKNDSGTWTKDGKNLEIKCIVAKDYTEYCLLAERLKIELSKQGIKFTPSYMSDSGYSQAIKSGSYDVAIAEIALGSWLDLESVFKTKGALNANGYSNKTLDELFAKASSVSKKEDLIKAYDEIKAVLLAELPAIGVYINGNSMLVSDKLYGITAGGIYPWDIFANVNKWYVAETSTEGKQYAR